MIATVENGELTDENRELTDENRKLTDEQRNYESETGKRAVWREKITKGFEKWQKGEKIYGEDRKGVGILVSDETKTKWQDFAKAYKFSTISKLIREAVNFYIDFKSNKTSFKNISKLSHSLKEPLTSIQGFSQLIIENESSDLKPSVLVKIKEILNQSIYLENKINEIISDIEPQESKYEILVIEDDSATITVLMDYFESKGHTCKGVSTGSKGLKELNVSIPKVILLDIILPDINGYDICKKIKKAVNLKNIPVYFITAIPEIEVKQKLEETGADGYFLKPFKFKQFQILLDYL